MRTACDALDGFAKHFADLIYFYFNYGSRWTIFKGVEKGVRLTVSRR